MKKYHNPNETIHTFMKECIGPHEEMPDTRQRNVWGIKTSLGSLQNFAQRRETWHKDSLQKTYGH